MNTKQHRTTTTYRHVLNVVLFSYKINTLGKIHQDVNALIAGAFLHDYFLYDWRQFESWKKKFKHGFKHPETALINASHDFTLNDKVRNIIYQHMWPYTITKIPKCREAVIVLVADKLCAVEEIFGFGKRYILINGKRQMFDVESYIETQLKTQQNIA